MYKTRNYGNGLGFSHELYICEEVIVYERKFYRQSHKLSNFLYVFHTEFDIISDTIFWPYHHTPITSRNMEEKINKTIMLLIIKNNVSMYVVQFLLGYVSN
jgi:hypothetical protein